MVKGGNAAIIRDLSFHAEPKTKVSQIVLVSRLVLFEVVVVVVVVVGQVVLVNATHFCSVRP